VPGQQVTSMGRVFYPVGAVDYLAAHDFAGNLAVHFNHGAFVSWKLWPRVKVSMDSRYEVAYPPGAFEDNLALYAGQGDSPQILARYSADAVLVPEWSPLNELLPEHCSAGDGECWRRVYRDDAFSLYIRTPLSTSLPYTDRTGERIMGCLP
jgi:hypothetical protein